MNEPINVRLARIYQLSGPEEARRAYDEWAASYDDDTLQDLGYIAPQLAGEQLARALLDLGPARPVVLDAGCGTGLAGAELTAAAARLGLELGGIDGVDLSPGMLEQARRRGVYRSLSTGDLTRPLELPGDSYDALICTGTLTGGHVGPAAFAEFIRLVRPGGVIVASVHSAVWEDGGYRAELDRLFAAGLAEHRSVEERPYHVKGGISCRLCVLRVPSPHA